jgi:glycosyltransferase involved in cell wall biosynthesis
LADQTLKPDSITLIDDGSQDSTIKYAREFCDANDMDINIIKRKKPIGKTPTLKRQSRESDADVEFILDGDTILESPNYIERTVEELYKGAGIARPVLPVPAAPSYRCVRGTANASRKARRCKPFSGCVPMPGSITRNTGFSSS